jgi:hypothetical protein
MQKAHSGIARQATRVRLTPVSNNQSLVSIRKSVIRRRILLSDNMRDVIYLLFHLLTTIAKLLRPGGSKTIIAENLLLKQQLIIHSRSRQRAPNLSTQDRALLGFWSLFLNPKRIARSAIIIKPSTLLRINPAKEPLKLTCLVVVPYL